MSYEPEDDSTAAALAGFEYEAPDNTVGLWGGWVHICNEETGDDSADVAENRAFQYYVGNGGNRYGVIEVTLVCNGCERAVTYVENDWDPEYEPGY